jgi:exosome complex component RRP4
MTSLKVDIRLTGVKSNTFYHSIKTVVLPAEVVASELGSIRGHGTYSEGEKLFASTAGVVEKVNKLVCVRPLKTKYNGEIGDIVVGRVTEVLQRKWKVDTNSRVDSILQLSAVNLPGNVTRRRTAADELLMREYFVEGDLLAAEVQSISHIDGSLSLHRVKTGQKLTHGSFLKVQPALIKRTKTHYVVLPCGVLAILGVNGYIWISIPCNESTGPAVEPNLPSFSAAQRETIARIRNCIAALSTQSLSISHTSIACVYESSLSYSVEQLLKPEVQEEITCDAT